MQWERFGNAKPRPRVNSAASIEFDLSAFDRRRMSGPNNDGGVGGGGGGGGYGMFCSMRRSFADIQSSSPTMNQRRHNPNHLYPPESLYRSSSAGDIGSGGERRWSSESGAEDHGFAVNSSREDLIPRGSVGRARGVGAGGLLWRPTVDIRQQQFQQLVGSGGKPRFVFVDTRGDHGGGGVGGVGGGLSQTMTEQLDAESLMRLKKGAAAAAGPGAEGTDGGPPNGRGRTFKTESLFFADGKREIDYILAYKDFRDDEDAEKKTEEQYIYEKNIKEAGLQIERVDKRYSKDGKTYFLKIHAPLDVLTRYADILNIRMPIKLDEQRHKHDGWFSGLMTFFDYDSTLIPPEPDYFTCAFTRSKEDRFIIKHLDDDYTNAQRSYIVYQILRRARFAKVDENDEDNNMKFGIRRLIGNGTYDAAFPLHDGPHDKDSPNGAKCERRVLYEQWARVAMWFKKQPLWVVRRYFGDQIGLYFTWLGFYTRALMPPAVLGVFTFFFGVCFIYSGESTPSQEICDPKGAGNMTMCPLCDEGCDYWQLQMSCTFSKFTYLFDNPITVFFSIFMSFWATMFIELWKRKQSIVQWEWDLQGIEEEEEARPEFEAEVRTRRLNPVTQTMEPYLPRWKKVLRTSAVYSIVFFILSLVIASVFGIVVYRLAFVSIIHRLSVANRDDFFARHAKTVASLSGAFLNLVVIVILNYLYAFVATSLTNMEYPRTQSEFEDSYTLKMFLFQFINYYSSLVYIAFFKGKLAGHPGSSEARASFTYDLCDPAGCLFELCIQLAIIMIGKQALNGFAEITWPYLTRLWRRITNREIHDQDYHSKHATRWEEDYELENLDRMALFEEYLEMVIQYGFVTLFVAAFPLAPFFAVLNNIFEIRLDAFKYVSQFRRPLAKRAMDIGAWFGILKVITYLAVTCNAFVIAYTSDFIPRKVYEYGYSPTSSLNGFVNASLSVFDVRHFPTNASRPKVLDPAKDPQFCRYRGFREPPSSWSWNINGGGPVPGALQKPAGNVDDEYGLTTMYWHIFAARLVFVILFEHLIFSLTYLISSMIPDVPVDLKIQQQREATAAREALFEGEQHYFRDRRRSRSSSTSSSYGPGTERLPSETKLSAADAAATATATSDVASSRDSCKTTSNPSPSQQRHGSNKAPLSRSSHNLLSAVNSHHVPGAVRDPSTSPAFVVEEVAFGDD